MLVSRRLGGLPLAVYVVALLLIPLLGVGIFSFREIERNNESANAASSLSEASAIHASAASLLVPLEVDRVASLGLVRIHELGLDPDLVKSMLGLDLDALVAENDVRLDAAFDALEASLASPDTVERSEDVVAIRELIETEGARSADGMATFETVERSFENAFSYVESLLSRSNSTLLDAEYVAPEAIALVRRLNLVVDVILTARQEAETFGSIVFGEGASAPSDMMSDGIRHVDALDAASSVDPVAITQLRNVYSDLPAMPEGLDSTPFDSMESLASVDFDSITDALLGHIEYLELVAEFSVDRADAVSGEVDDWARNASDRNRSTLLFFAAVGLASLAFGLVVIRSFAKPLNALCDQAERISSGELSADPLELAGPSDVRKVTGAINDMASTLALVDDHMQALAVAENGEGPELQDLPGHVGASMRTSMERVTALTARLQASEARLAEEARIDNLTGLPNRFAVLEYLDRELRSLPKPGMTSGKATSTGVMFVDIDGFKSVNDTHGHAVGDVVLREIAQRLSGSIREIDFVARLGGDEFLIVISDVADTGNLITFGERMIEQVEQPYVVGEQLFGVSASVGVTVIEPGDHSMSAVERADAAVYQAKRRGRRRVEMFDKELQRSIEQQAELELALRQAIQHDELRIYLQPLADMTTGHAAGAEALVRWERPGVGLVPPADFIPIAERSGLIFELERWVLEAACRCIAEWTLAGRGAGMRLAVNISGRHLIEGELVADLDAALAATGADPGLLEIELTESQLLDDVERASDVLAAVRSRGVKVAIDDFGTGYSSMTYLQKLPVDVVKIDRSFIATATANEFDSTIVESVVTIGRALSLDIVAEGIETFDQLAYAIEAGVTLGQGFLFARPMPVGEAESILFGPPLFDAERVRREAGLGPVPWSALPPAGAPIDLPVN
jgi:diguanylate cyclase (GGDEF)-like protein